MPTNVNEAVWTTGEATFSGGGAQAAVLIPTDINTIVVDIADATTADVIGIEVSQDPREALVGITERPLRYAQVAINDLGGSGELRMNAAAGLDFTDDGWAVGDTFEVFSHRIPDFGPEGTHPTTIADKQVFTVSSVSALVLAFSEDPAFSLAEGDVVVAQSRAAVAEGSLTYSLLAGLDGSTDQVSVTVTDVAGRKVRLIQSTGTATVTWEFKGNLQSKVRPAPFVANVESRPFSGAPAGVEGIELVADAAPVWSQDVVAGEYGVQRFATATVAGTDFDALSLKQYDRVNFSGHSVTGNTGLFMVRKVTGTKIQFYEPLKGVAGTDDARVRLGQYVSAASGVFTLADYTELMLQLLSTGDSFLTMQDQGLVDTDDFLDTGQAGRTDFLLSTTGAYVDSNVGPFGVATAIKLDVTANDTSILSDGAAGFGAASTGYSVGGWFKVAALENGSLLSKSDATPETSITGSLDLRATVGGAIEASIAGADIADPGTWVLSTAYSKGDRRRPVADDQGIAECEIAGTSAATEPTWPAEGSTVVDGTVTWRQVTDDRSLFHNVLLSSTYTAAEWVFLVVVREADGNFVLYKDGVEAASRAVPAADTTPGSFGTPVPGAFTVAYTPPVGKDVVIGGVTGAVADITADAAYVFFAEGTILSAVEVAALFDTALDIGIN